MNRTRLRLMTLAAALVCALLTAGAAACYPSVSPSALPVLSQTGAPLYSLRDCDGLLCVYQGTQLVCATEIATATLPLTDRQELLRGIPIYSEQELAHRLEDFGA